MERLDRMEGLEKGRARKKKKGSGQEGEEKGKRDRKGRKDGILTHV